MLYDMIRTYIYILQLHFIIFHLQTSPVDHKKLFQTQDMVIGMADHMQALEGPKDLFVDPCKYEGARFYLF